MGEVDFAAGVSFSDEPDHPRVVWIPGGTFTMGSDEHYPEEVPAHRVKVSGFWIDQTPNRQFQAFARATGHATFAEIVPDPKDYPGSLPHLIFAGSLVFTPPTLPVDPRDWSQWWTLMKGANWRRPYGDELTPDGKHIANIWQDYFPFESQSRDGFELTSPVMTYPPNGYGLYDVIGMSGSGSRTGTLKDMKPRRKRPAAFRKIRAVAPYRPATIRGSRTPRIPRKVIKGGSHLCAPNYCRLYRPATRHAEPVDTSTSHVGFRRVVRTGLIGINTGSAPWSRKSRRGCTGGQQ